MNNFIDIIKSIALGFLIVFVILALLIVCGAFMLYHPIITLSIILIIISYFVGEFVSKAQ